MAVNIIIKQEKKLFKKILNIWDIIEMWESSCIYTNGDESIGLIGIQDEYLIIDSDFLNPTKRNNFARMNKIKSTNKYILFDRLNLNRGIDVLFINNDIILCINYPATLNEIKNFYNLIQNICKKIKRNIFVREDDSGKKEVNINEIPNYINYDYFNSYNYLKQVYSEIENRIFILFGVTNPIYIEKKVLNNLGIDNNPINEFMFKYENYLNNLQQKDRYYTIPNCYKKEDNTFFCGYPCPPECETIVPIEPENDYSFYKQINPKFAEINVDKYYAFFGYNNKTYQVEYSKFIEKFNKNYYDSKHIIIEYSDNTIKDLIDNNDAKEI